MRLLWDDAAIEHIARHRVETWEVEEALSDKQRKPSHAYRKGKERRVAYLGKTDEGRILFIVLAFTHRGLYPVTAREASKREKQSYRRRA
jgi:uncharacterized DUF497 family protein